MAKKMGLMLLGLIVVSAGTSVTLLARKTQKPDNPRITLYERAKKATGHKLVVAYSPGRATIFPNVEELARRSDLIVVGRAVSHKSNLSADERFITQDFMVKVQEVIKGDLPPGAAL